MSYSTENSEEPKKGYRGRNASILRRKPIIRLSDDTHTSPCTWDGQVQVYLPAETKSEYKTVKDVFIQDEQSLNFLKELGLEKPDIFAEIKEFVYPEYHNPDTTKRNDKYFEDFEKLLFAFGKEDSAKQRDMIEELKNLHIVQSIEADGQKIGYRKPNKVYFKTKELQEYFEGCDEIYFLSDALTAKFKNKTESLTCLLRMIGCEDKPRRIQVEPTLSYEEKKGLRNGISSTYERYTIDYDYEGLDNVLLKIDEHKSVLLWSLLLKSLDSFENSGRENFFKGEYSWKYYTVRRRTFLSKFAKTLRSKAWLIDSNNNFVFPNQLSLAEIPDFYKKDDENVEVLINNIGLSTDEIKQIEQKTGGKFIPKGEYEEFQRWKEKEAEKKTSQKTDTASWIAEVDPDSIEIDVSEMEPQMIETPDLRGQHISQNDTTKDDDQEPEDKDNRDNPDIGDSRKLKDIGKWGEKAVYNYLQKQVVQENMEIVWLNENSEEGKGYDILITVDGKEAEYIEAKSKTDSFPQLFEISGTQWEFARKLYHQNEGDKYKFFIEKNAGTKNASIEILKNPIKLWKDGKLYAHPVNFER